MQEYTEKDNMENSLTPIMQDHHHIDTEEAQN